ncbi:c8fc23e9-1efd-473f-af24-dadee03ee630 [Thermothielavioides terrestris]|nr:c8fc23e9-1efd-473f-af24-dadee03ee630 [Thermothielavioides terrestris]
MPSYMSVGRTHRSHGPVDRHTLANRLSKSERGKPRMGLVKSQQWKRLPIEGLYQVVISEVLDDGRVLPLERGRGKAFAVTTVLDLGLRMLESPRGRAALESLARKAICVWRERPLPGPVYEPSSVDVPAAVEEFLRCVRCCFPLVKLDDRNGFCREEDNNRMSHSWVDDYSTVEQLSFNPKAAAVLHLNWQLMEKLYWARLKADVARRQRRDDQHIADTVRFHRLQFHLAAMVTHHLCHLFVNFLRKFEDLAHEVADADLMRLVRRYDPGAEFEVDFFGGRPKLFIDYRGPREESYPGQSYVIKRGPNGSRVAAVVPQCKIESYLQGG